jgi:hypothetical protein
MSPDSPPEESDPLSREQPWLAGIYGASVLGRVAFGSNAGRRVPRFRDEVDPESIEALASPRCATVSGFSLHANTAVHAGDRQRLERLVRYCARPPLAIERLEPLADGRLLYRFKRAFRDGTTHVVFEPLEMLEKLAALVPVPKSHLVRYSGVLAPAAKWWSLIMPVGSRDESAQMVACGPEAGSSNFDPQFTGFPPRRGFVGTSFNSCFCQAWANYTWAALMKRVWALDVLECTRCGRRMRILAAIHSPEAARKILNSLGLPSRAPPVAPAASEFTTRFETF